ncbi:hypothetical protein GTA08_BOTSDO08534 [Neofusicoccum parvum]|uniref:Uncharacterized protein n=1 Tax=Neofusicoccum parvum TaxID=310453 RepID=A0ACB5SFZ6_9PEZI|nr:hypothetical protein GTA08_BOTSDO08534 [Neofusicoccum parvum]
MASQYHGQNLPLQVIVNDAADRRKIYTCGDTVSGVVRVDTRSKTTHVIINFKAKAKTEIVKRQGNNSRIYKSKVYLFRYSSVFFSGENIASLASAGDPFVSFKFEFAFPSAVMLAPTASGCLPFGRSGVFEHTPGHMLPPSMLANRGGMNDRPQTVEYYLEARMANTSHKLLDFRSEVKARRTLTFSPPCMDLSSSSIMCKTVSLTRQTHRLHPSHENNHHGIRSHLKEFFPSSSDPCAKFFITTRAPASVRAGYPFPVNIHFVHMSRTPDIPDPPPVGLRGFRVAFKALTRIRVPYNGFNGPKEWQHDVNHTIEVCQRHYNGENEEIRTIADGEDLSIAELSRSETLSVGRIMPPTFKTYGLARVYWLKVVLWVECAGKVFEVNGMRQAVKVLPWPSMETGAETERAQEEDAPPPYEEVASI